MNASETGVGISVADFFFSVGVIEAESDVTRVETICSRHEYGNVVYYWNQRYCGKAAFVDWLWTSAEPIDGSSSI